MSKKKTNPITADPSRTATLRRVFSTDVRRRWKRIRRKVIQLVEHENVFGIKPVENEGYESNVKRSDLRLCGNSGGNSGGFRGGLSSGADVLNARFGFNSTAKQVDAFEKLLLKEMEREIVSEQMRNKYWEKYIQEGYEKGAGRAFDDTKKASLTTKAGADVSDFYAGSRAEFLQSSFGAPETIDKVKLLASRTFTDLKNVTTVVATEIRRTLTDGLVRGDNPKTIARALAKRVDSIGKVRAEQIARTEIIRAHAEGQLDAMDKMGVEKVGVSVEWSTAGDDRVCPRCADLEGVVLKLKEAHGLIPRHVSCRCAFLPAGLGEDPTGQKKTKGEIDTSIRESIRHDIPKGRLIKGQRKFKDPKTGKFTVPVDKGKKSLADVRRSSAWKGATKKIDASRPKGVFDAPTPIKPKSTTIKPKPTTKPTPTPKPLPKSVTVKPKTIPAKTKPDLVKRPIKKQTPPKATKSTANNPDLIKRDEALNHPDVIKDLKVPKRLYHVTSKDNLTSIKSKGLKALKKTSGEGEMLGTYMTDDPADVILKQWDIKIPKDKIVVLEIDTAGMNLRLDPEYFYWDDVTKKGAAEYIEAVNAGEESLVLYSRKGISSKSIKVRKDLNPLE